MTIDQATHAAIASMFAVSVWLSISVPHRRIGLPRLVALAMLVAMSVPREPVECPPVAQQQPPTIDVVQLITREIERLSHGEN